MKSFNLSTYMLDEGRLKVSKTITKKGDEKPCQSNALTMVSRIKLSSKS
jgi:hypothetical protein